MISLDNYAEMEALATLGRDAMVAGGGEEYEVGLPFLQNFKDKYLNT